MGILNVQINGYLRREGSRDGVCVCVCERETETERQTDRQTDRQRQRDRDCKMGYSEKSSTNSQY